MVERKIVLPKQVPEYYHEIQDKEGSFVTLMGCYPIGSNAKRMMVVAKKVANESKFFDFFSYIHRKNLFLTSF